MIDVEKDEMPNLATILVASRSKNQSGNWVTTYSPTAYDDDLAIPCRVYAGARSDDLVLIGNILAGSQVWTVVFEAGTAIKQEDRVWIKDWEKYIGVRAIADKGDRETAVVVICVEAP